MHHREVTDTRMPPPPTPIKGHIMKAILTLTATLVITLACA